jgi:nitroreductase/dihydropteridine reductase
MSSKVIQSLEWRYATKKFNAAKRLSAEKLEILKKAFNLTATSYGLQPLKMVVISDSDTKQKLVPITMNQAQVVDCSHVLVLCTETKVTSAYIKEYFDSVENIRNTPREILHSFET